MKYDSFKQNISGRRKATDEAEKTFGQVEGAN